MCFRIVFLNFIKTKFNLNKMQTLFLEIIMVKKSVGDGEKPIKSIIEFI